MKDNTVFPVMESLILACPIKPVANIPHLITWSLAHGSPAAPPPPMPTHVVGVENASRQNTMLN